MQDGKIDCSLQPQPGGFLDQSHMLFNNGGELFFLVLFVKFYFGMETNELRYGL